MKISAQELLISSGIGDDIATAVEQAVAAYKDTDRGASVTLKITVKFDKEKGCGTARGRVQLSLPRGDCDTINRKSPSIGLFQIGNDHPGQQTIT
jgi:hypothetical protein